jgi:cytochrome P450
VHYHPSALDLTKPHLPSVTTILQGPYMHLILFDLFGNGILNTDGKLWRSHRKLASPEFSIKKLKTLGSTVYTTHALKLLDVLVNKASQGVDMQVGIIQSMKRWPSGSILQFGRRRAYDR